MAGRVLVVDDEKMIVKGLKFSLMQDYSVVDCAYDGEEYIMATRSSSESVGYSSSIQSFNSSL